MFLLISKPDIDFRCADYSVSLYLYLGIIILTKLKLRAKNLLWVCQLLVSWSGIKVNKGFNMAFYLGKIATKISQVIYDILRD